MESVEIPERSRGFSWGSLCRVLVLSFACYVLSTGPVVKILTMRTTPIRTTEAILETWYSPLRALCRSSPPLDRFLHWYIRDVWKVTLKTEIGETDW